MTPEEKQEIIDAVLLSLFSDSNSKLLDITGLDAAQSLDGISTFPAVLTTTNNGVTTKALVSVPISLLTQSIQDVIDDAEEATADAQSAAAGWAAAAHKSKGEITIINGNILNLQDADKSISTLTAYAECSTAANVSAKVVTVPYFALPTSGGCLHIKMEHANTAVSGVTLNINATGAKDLLYNGSAVSATNTWEDNEVLEIYYDGENYQATNAQGGGGSADKVLFDNSQSGLTSTNVQGAIEEMAVIYSQLDQENSFIPARIRSDKLISSSSPYSIITYNGGHISGYYFLPLGCKRIIVEGIESNQSLVGRLSKTPTDTSESLVVPATTGGKINYTVISEEYRYFCFDLYKSNDFDLSNVVVQFSKFATDPVVSPNYSNNIWKTYIDDSTIDEPLSQVPSRTRRTYYEAIRDIRFYGCDFIPRTLYLLWNTENASYQSLRISKYKETTQSWVAEFVYTGNLHANINSDGTAYIKIEQDVNGDTTKKVELLIDLSYIPTTGQPILNALDSNPEWIFSEKTYYNDYDSAITSLQDELNDVETDLQGKIGCTIENLDILKDLPVTENTYINKANGAESSLSSFFSVLDVPCSDYAGQRLYAYGEKSSLGYCCRSIVFWNGTDYITGYDGSATFATNGFLVPNNATKLSICFAYKNESVSPKEKGVYYLSTKYGSPSIKQLEPSAVIDYSQVVNTPDNVRDGLTPRRMNKITAMPCIAFTFDDCHANDEQVVSLFDEYGVTCGFAFIASDANMVSKGTKYLQYQKKGYSILDHSINGNPFTDANYTVATATAAIAKAMENFEKYGFVVNGFIAPSSQISDTLLPIMGKFHAYVFRSAANVLNDTSRDLDKLLRASLQTNTISQCETLIEDAITDNKCLVFYGHSGDFGTSYSAANNEVWDIEKLETILQYAIEKRNNGECIIGNTDYIIQQYYNKL